MSADIDDLSRLQKKYALRAVGHKAARETELASPHTEAAMAIQTAINAIRRAEQAIAKHKAGQQVDTQIEGRGDILGHLNDLIGAIDKGHFTDPLLPVSGFVDPIRAFVKDADGAG